MSNQKVIVYAPNMYATIAVVDISFQIIIIPHRVNIGVRQMFTFLLE